MPVHVTYPGLYIEELPSSAHTITPAPTSITVFVGYTHPFLGEVVKQKKWGDAIRIFSYADYERWFGGMYRSFVPSDVADAVYQFFLNGGSDAYVVAIKPNYHGAGGVTAIVPASDTLAPTGITFTSKHLTADDNKVSITVRNITAARTSADIVVTYGNQLEQYRGVTLDAASTDFIEKRLANSNIVTVRPVLAGYSTTYAPAPATLTLDLGRMTIAGPVYDASDFNKVFDTNEPLDKVDIFNLLTIPGVTDNGVWSKALQYCERKLAFFIMDPPVNASADDLAGAAFTKIADLLDQVPHASPNGALYFPYLKTVDPVPPPPGQLARIRSEPPSGFVAGVYARTDTRRGVWKAPAGLEASVLNTTGVVDSGRMTDMMQGTVNELGVNVLRSFPGSGTVIWGARTVGTSLALEQWKYVPVRRMALFIEQTLFRNLGWVVFEPNDEPLWTAIRISVENFLLSLFRQQAFQGKTPSEAFQVVCDKTTTTATDIAEGKVNIVVGFRPLKPAEFVIIKIAQLAGQAP
jgi:uncharacterized protein